MKILLRCKKLTKDFGGLRAVHEVSFALEQGEILGIIGPNGAGKTTLFNVISGFERPTDGNVEFRGQDITGWKPHRVCRLGLARTFQSGKRFAHLSVLDTLMTAVYNRINDAEHVEEEAIRVAKKVGLEEVILVEARHLPVGYQNRLELGKALATGPTVLMLDEIFAGFSSAADIDELSDLLKQVNDEGITVVIIEHVLRAVMGLADRILVLNHGLKIAEGTPEAVTSDQLVIEAYLGRGYHIA